MVVGTTFDGSYTRNNYILESKWKTKMLSLFYAFRNNYERFLISQKNIKEWFFEAFNFSNA